MGLPARVLLLLAVSSLVVASDPPPPSDIQPNFFIHNIAESNSTKFRNNVARAYKYLLKTVPTKGPTQYLLGSGSGTIYSYGQCYNISGKSCHSCLNATALTMGTEWLGAKGYLKGNDSGCFIRYENYEFSTGLQQPWPSSALPPMAPVSPSADPSLPSDILYFFRNVAESNSTRFRNNVARAYKYLLKTVPTIGPTQYMLGSGLNLSSFTVYSYGECYNISRNSCYSCLNATAVTMGTKWLGARLYRYGCIIRYENYDFSTELPQPWSTALAAMAPVSPRADPSLPSDILTFIRSIAESNSTKFRNNVARAYKYLLKTVPTEGPTQYMLGSGSGTVYSYGQCHNISGNYCHSCLNATAVTMGTKWLGNTLERNGNDSGCFIHYENYEFNTGLQQPWSSSAPPAMAPVSPSAAAEVSTPPPGAVALVPPPQHSGGLDAPRDAVTTFLLAAAILCLTWT